MRALLAAVLVAATLPLALPSAGACHMPLESSEEAWDPFDRPNEPHYGPADFHWHECGDGHAWVCVHDAAFDECVRTW